MGRRHPVSLSVIQGLVLALGILMILFIWGLFVHQNALARTEQLDARAAEHRHVAVMVAEHLRQITDRAVAIARLADPATAAFGPELSRFLAADPVFSRLSLYGPGGEGRHASHSPLATLPPGWLAQVNSQVAHFGFVPFLPTQTADQPLAGRWRLPLLVPLADTGGIHLAGIMLLELELGYLAGLYQHLELGHSGLIRLVDRQGEERMRANGSGMVEGGHAPDNPGWPKTGQHQGRVDAAGAQSLFHALPEQGFAVLVSRLHDDMLAGFYQQRSRQWLLKLLLSLAIAGAVGWLVRLLRDQRQFVQALEQSGQQNRLLIQRLEQAHSRSSAAAATDHLSGLYNRRQFIELAGRQLAEQRQRRELSALLFIDLDRFKSINDTLGHHTGDLLLQAVAGRIRRMLAAGDQAARFGGDEFVVLLAGQRSESRIEEWVRRLTERLSATYSLEGSELNTSPSIGIAICPRDAQDIDGLLSCADAAMYSAKRAGRGQYRFFDPSLNRVDMEEFQLEQALGDALRLGQIRLHFQPLVRVGSMSLAGYEALARWQHPQFGLIYPDRFIPIAERSGFILALGREVLRLACRELAQWPPERTLAVNVSPMELGQADFAERVLAELAQQGLDPARLELEITETSVLERQQLAIQQLCRLKAAGVGISLDDFGKGYAGFAHLQALPLTRLKIERSLIAQLSNSHDDSLIVSSTITLAKRLALQVVAEGVETAEQLVYLKLAGCDFAQGYHLGRPMPAEQLAEFEQAFSTMRASA